MPPQTAHAVVTPGASHPVLAAVPRWVAVAAFWTLLAAISATQIWWLAGRPGERINIRIALVWQITYYLAWIPLTILIWRVTRGWTADSMGWRRALALHVTFALLVAAAHIALVIAVAAPLSGEPLVPSMFWMQMRGRLHMQILIYCAIVVTGLAMTIHAKYRDRQLAAVRLEAQLTEARLDALRTHLQPHFLFNSLHSIAWLARSGDNAGVVRLVAALSDLLRSVLDASTRRVPLRDELLLVERYLEIQRVRFADRLTTKFEIAADTNEVPVPPLVVQPLVENALRHGLTPRPGPGTLLVRAFRDDGLLVVVVEDDGSGLPGGFALESCIGTGLRNLASRLAAEYGPRQSVGIEPRAGGGVRATLRVPFETV